MKNIAKYGVAGTGKVGHPSNVARQMLENGANEVHWFNWADHDATSYLKKHKVLSQREELRQASNAVETPWYPDSWFNYDSLPRYYEGENIIVMGPGNVM